MYDHGAFTLCCFLPDHLYKLEDTFGSVGRGDTVIWPGSVVKMHHVLHLISLMREAEQQHVHRSFNSAVTLSQTEGFLLFCGGFFSFFFPPKYNLSKKSNKKVAKNLHAICLKRGGGIRPSLSKGHELLFLGLRFVFCFPPLMVV